MNCPELIPGISHLYVTFFVILGFIYSNRIIVFNCTEAWAPICIYLHVSGQNESVQFKPIDTLCEVFLFQSSAKVESSTFSRKKAERVRVLPFTVLKHDIKF